MARYNELVQSAVTVYSCWRTVRRWSASQLLVYLIPKSSTTRVKGVSRVACIHRTDVCLHGVYPCVAKWVTGWLYANMPDRGMPRLISNRTNPS
jgi:hypothetical protein